MNVFIIGSPLETAEALDPRRLNKQIVECKQMLNAIEGQTKAWRNHPCTLQYEKHVLWLQLYRACLVAYKGNNIKEATICSDAADSIKPHFLDKAFYKQMMRRLYTKDPVHYAQWAHLGTSEENWYWSPSEQQIIKYVNGKRV